MAVEENNGRHVTVTRRGIGKFELHLDFPLRPLSGSDLLVVRTPATMRDVGVYNVKRALPRMVRLHALQTKEEC